MATMGAVKPGRIATIAVTEGQTVEGGALLTALDDSVQRVRTAAAEAEAGSTLDVSLARARMEQAQRDLEWLISHDEHYSPKELNDARTEAEIARLDYEVAQFDHEQAVRTYQRERLLLEHMSIRAPFPGYVSEVLKEVGETVDEQEGVLLLVQLDPLMVSVDCPMQLARSVRLGDRAVIRPVDRRWGPRVGEVVLANKVADAASQTLKVKLSVNNGDGGWISGMKVVVDLSDVQRGEETHTSLTAGTGPATSGPGPTPAAGPLTD